VYEIMSEKKICPLTMGLNFVKECRGKFCAWFDIEYNCCALLSIAKSLSYMSEEE